MTDETGADTSLAPEIEPVETEVEAEEIEGSESEADSPSAEETDAKPDPFQERIDKLTRRFRETERGLDEVARERDELKKRLDALDKPEPVGPKTLADFDYDEAKFQEYIFAEAEKRGESAAKKVAENFKAEAERERKLQSHKQREASFAKGVDDFYDAVADLYIPQAALDEIYGSDVGPEIAYYLAKHPEVTSDLRQLPERAVIRRMVSLESQLQADKSKAKRKDVSEAPPPPSKKVRGSEPGMRVSTTDPASDKLTDEQWFKQEALRESKKRGG